MRSWPHPKIDPLQQRAAAAGSERAGELRQQAGEEGQHLRVAGVLSRSWRSAPTGSNRATAGSAELSAWPSRERVAPRSARAPRKTRYALPPRERDGPSDVADS